MINKLLIEINEKLEKVNQLIEDNKYIEYLDQSLAKQNDLIRDYENKLTRISEIIKCNCLKSDKWEDLGFCNLIPTGKITYKSLPAKKVEELMKTIWR